MWMRKYKEWTETCTQCARTARIMQRKNKNERLPTSWARKGDGSLICPDHIEAKQQQAKTKTKTMKATANSQGSITFSNGKERFVVTLHRTLRLPEDSKTHALPPSLGGFPIKLVDDYKKTVPEKWLKHGGVFFPMWQREAMWLAFRAMGGPCAVKVAAGKVNAVSGKKWKEKLKKQVELGNGTKGKQDYLVAPPQPWLDGFNAGEGVIKQFVAMPLGMGYTVEKQVTGKETHGGLQILVVPAKAGAIPGPRLQGFRGASFAGASQTMDFAPTASPAGEVTYSSNTGPSQVFCAANIMEPSEDFFVPVTNGETKTSGGVLRDSAEDMSRGIDIDMERSVTKGGPSLRSARRRSRKGAEMGLAAGGTMKQKLYPDPHSIEVWDQDNSSRMFIHIVNSEMYEQITGEKPPASPISAQTYTAHGYPWFDLWDDEMADIKAPVNLAGVQTISQLDAQHGFEGQQDDSAIHEQHILKHKLKTGKLEVRDGKW